MEIKDLIEIFGFAGAIIAVYVRGNIKLELNEQRTKYLEQQVEKVENKLREHEGTVAEKLDEIHNDLTKIQINIARIVKQ